MMRTAIFSFLCVMLLGSMSVRADGVKPATTAAKPEEKKEYPITSPYFIGNYLSGDYAARSQNNEAAAKIFTQAIKEHPKDPVVLKNAYTVLLSLGDVDQAVNIAHQYLEVAKADSNINLLLAATAMHAKEYGKAETILATGTSAPVKQVADSVNNVIIPFLKLWTKVGQGKTDEVEKDTAAMLEGGKSPALFMSYQMALMQDVLGHTEKAGASLAAITGKEEILPYHFVNFAGNFYERTDKPAVAEGLYEKYIKQYPQSGYFVHSVLRAKEKKQVPPMVVPSAEAGFAEVLLEAVRVLYGSGYYNEGLFYLRLALYLNPKNEEAQMMLASYFESQKHYEDAISAYNDVEKDSDFYLLSRIAIAENLYESGKKDKAVKQLKSVTDNNQPSQIALLTLADLLRKDLRYKEAAESYTRIISTIATPEMKNWPVFFARGICYERSGNWDKAEQDLQTALKLKPGQPEVLNYLGYSWIDRDKNIEQAKTMVEEAVKARPDDAQIVDSMGWALFKIKQYDQASEYLERAAELTPNDAVINDHLGDSYWRQGRHNEARFQWERALKFFKEGEDLSTRDVEKKIRDGLPEIAG